MLYMKLLKCNKILCFLIVGSRNVCYYFIICNYVIFILGVKLVDNEDLFVDRFVFVMMICYWFMLRLLSRVVVGFILIILV